MTSDIAVLIPAYKPEPSLVTLVRQLRRQALCVVVVDDGSGCAYEEPFRLAAEAGCVVLTHPQNSGKGRALKTGIRYLHEKGYAGVVTADADGQHTLSDILRVRACLAKTPDSLILGARSVREMPPRSRLGNSLTRFLFATLYDLPLCDTQTGLRGIPLGSIAPQLLALAGERYEYETNLLIHAKALFAQVLEVPIETIYLNHNAASHFNAVRDGLKIYRLLFSSLPTFLLSSLLAFGMDFLLFSGFYYALHWGTVVSTVCARCLSATANYQINRRFVFRNAGRRYTLLRYFLLAVCLLFLNSVLMLLLVDGLKLPAVWGKLIVESSLYCVSYLVQSKLAAKDSQNAACACSDASDTCVPPKNETK